jgi:hypothetical protein
MKRHFPVVFAVLFWCLLTASLSAADNQIPLIGEPASAFSAQTTQISPRPKHP